MSLLRLLKSGRSLVDFKESESRYRMRERGMLPKFSSSNPFMARPADGKEQAAPVEAAESTLPPASEPDVSAVPERPLPQLAITAVSTIQPGICRTGFVGRVLLKLRQLSGQWNPFAHRSIPHPVRKVSSTSAISGVVQGELSLENIRVVRNDLTEADVEVVPVKSGAVKKPLTDRVRDDELEMTGSRSI